MLQLKQGTITFDASRCRQCGVCIAACPQKALRSSAGYKQYQIICDKSKCIHCGFCARICEESLRNGQVNDSTVQIITARQILLAWNRDSNIRYLASSGGITRGIIRGVLAHSLYDAVYSLVYFAPGRVAGRWLVQYPEEEHIPCSLYRPILWGDAIETINPAWKKVLLVGLPCQIRAARVFLKYRFPHLIISSVNIYCKKQKDFGYSRYIAGFLKQHWKLNTDLVYRGQGWPGHSYIRTDRGNITEKKTYSYPALCWNLSGCQYCFDSLNATGADITVADPWGIVEPHCDEFGQNLVFVWTEAGERLLSLPSLVRGQAVSLDAAAASISLSTLNKKRNDILPVRMGSREWFYRLQQWGRRKGGELFLPHIHRWRNYFPKGFSRHSN